MRSRATRFSLGAAVLIAIAAATFFVVRSESHLSALAASERGFDSGARAAADRLAELRAAQRSYVAAGQSADFWMRNISETTARLKQTLVSLRQSARTARGRQSLMEAEATLAEFETSDKRTREYLAAGDHLMAADVIFSEGGAVAATAAGQVETARVAEREGMIGDEGALRKREAAALAALATVTCVIVLLLLPRAGPPRADVAVTRHDANETQSAPDRTEPFMAAAARPARAASVLQTTADLCTEFGRVRDVDDLKRMLGRTAEIMEARGLAVWLGNANGADLQPVFTQGYSTHIVAQLPSVPRSAENAVARAYRTGVQQIVRSGPGRTNSAIVAPILTADGCIGALSAEIEPGTEGSEAAQTLATIIAAHLAGVLAGAGGPAASSERAPARG